MEQRNQDQHQEQQQIQWRRDKVQELCSKGYVQREISQILQVGLATVNRDISYLRNQSKTNIKKYIDEWRREMSGRTKCNYKRSMEYSTKYRR
jgi:transposase